MASKPERPRAARPCLRVDGAGLRRCQVPPWWTRGTGASFFWRYLAASLGLHACGTIALLWWPTPSPRESTASYEATLADPPPARPAADPALSQEQADLAGEDGADSDARTLPPAEMDPDFWRAIRAAVARHARYPAPAARNGEEGMVLVRLSVDRSGALQEAVVLSPCPPDLAAAGLRAIRRAAPFPVPTNAAGRLSAVLPIRFEMNGTNTQTEERHEHHGCD